VNCLGAFVFLRYIDDSLHSWCYFIRFVIAWQVCVSDECTFRIFITLSYRRINFLVDNAVDQGRSVCKNKLFLDFLIDQNFNLVVFDPHLTKPEKLDRNFENEKCKNAKKTVYKSVSLGSEHSHKEVNTLWSVFVLVISIENEPNNEHR
jgi:hypothetical protein